MNVLSDQNLSVSF